MRQAQCARERMRSRLASRETGAVAVEFALILPLLAMLLIGIVSVGLTYSDHLALTNTVREGGRFGASAPNTGSWGTSVVSQTVNVYANTNNPLPASNVCALLIQKAGATETSVQTSAAGCSTGSTAAGPVPSTPASIPDGCFVKVWAKLPSTINWVLGSSSVNLKARSVSLYDRSQAC